MKSESIRGLLFQVEVARRKLMQPYFVEIGLTLGQGQPRILKCLYEEEAMTQRELADRCGLDVTTMSRTLDRLEEAGLLIRQKNPGCRRSYRIALTEKGTEKAKLVCAGFVHIAKEMVKGFSPEEQEAMAKSLQHMRENLQASKPLTLKEIAE